MRNLKSVSPLRPIALLIAALALPAGAAPTTYQMELGTISGMGMDGAVGSVLSLLSGGTVGRVTRTVDLRLTSPTNLPADYQAVHTVPDGMRIGPQLPLKGEQRAASDGPAGAGELDGRILIYWGCSATVQKGQPEVIDLRTLGDKLPPEAQAMLRQRKAQGKAQSSVKQDVRSIHWPRHDPNYRGIPENASVVGQHVVKANFMSEDIRFELTPALDFMEPMGLKANSGNLKAAIPLAWNALGRARGYDLTAMGAGDEKEMVMWLAERNKSPMLPASQNNCVIPEGIFAKHGASIVTGYVHGPTQGFSFPPQKPGEKKPLIWSAVVKVSAIDGVMLGLGAAATDEAKDTATKSAVDAVIPGAGELLKGVKGLFGR